MPVPTRWDENDTLVEIGASGMLELIAPICFAMIRLFLNDRSTGVEVEDDGDALIVRLEG